MASAQQEQAARVQAKGVYDVRQVDLPPFRNGNPYGKEAVLDITDLYTYSSICVKFDLPLKRLGRVSLERNGREVFGVPADFFRERDEYLKNDTQIKGVDGATETRLTIDFADENLKTLLGIRRGELVMLDGERLTLKIKVNPRASGDPEIPSFSATARVSTAQAVRFDQIKFLHTSVTHSLVGLQKHDFPFAGMNNRIRRMFVTTENDDIKKIAIRRDTAVEREISVEDLIYNQQRYGDKKPPAKGFWIDFVELGWANDTAFIPAALNSLKLELDKATTGEVEFYVELLEVEAQVS
ncbi:major capsid protein P2 [Vibrio sp. SCSIO 43137]|uniref:major capsid protein P2 n=1 Tax=Vibrio sp. SCSIO 43137 TaxID=3021011 RepID=UPI0023077BB0|nr:major capsid protein P2 [Vibrio sp. SCSIO 43137]WCE29966.1 major capsid protein P2 [Vibrio sp. SCSIO 43137]